LKYKILWELVKEERGVLLVQESQMTLTTRIRRIIRRETGLRGPLESLTHLDGLTRSLTLVMMVLWRKSWMVT
jgi:hypothetical protein